MGKSEMDLVFHLPVIKGQLLKNLPQIAGYILLHLPYFLNLLTGQG